MRNFASNTSLDRSLPSKSHKGFGATLPRYETLPHSVNVMRHHLSLGIRRHCCSHPRVVCCPVAAERSPAVNP